MSDAAQIIAAHTWNSRTWKCGCGFTPAYDAVRTTVIATHAAHVLAVLSETHAVVELPEPEGDWDGTVLIPIRDMGDDDTARLRVDSVDQWGRRRIHLLGMGLPIDDGLKAAKVGAALLAAARVTEAAR